VPGAGSPGQEPVMIELGHLQIFTAEEVAERLGITLTRVRNFIKKGQLTARRVGKTYFITGKKLEEFLECLSDAQPAAHLPSDDVTRDISRIDAILGKNENSQRRHE